FALSDHGAHSFSVSLISAGSHSVTAVDTVSSTIAGSVTTSVSPAETTTQLASSARPVDFGQAVTFSVTVTAVAPGGGVPTGTVTLLDADAILAVVPLSSGTTSFTTSALSLGTHSIRAVYNSDGNYLTSTSETLAQPVGNSQQRFVAQVYLDLLHRPVDSSGL